MAATEAYRRATQALKAGHLRDFMRLWALLDPKRMDETWPGWAAAVTTLVERDRQRANALAAAYLTAARFESGVPGAPLVRLAPLAPVEQVATSLSVTARAGYFTALRYGPPEKAAQTALVRSIGAASRLVLDGGRETIRGSLAADPQGTGWRRVTSGGACSFCLMLAGRGDIYSAETADFASHDHCGCSAEAVYGGDKRAVKPYTPSQRFRTQEARDAHNARTRAGMTALGF